MQRKLCTLILCAFGLAHCADENHPQPIKNQNSSTQFAAKAVEVEFTDVNCQKNNFAKTDTSQMQWAKLYVRIVGGNPADFAMGLYNPAADAPLPTINSATGVITFNQPTAGTFSYQLLLRHRRACQSANPNTDCNLTQPLLSPPQAFDVAPKEFGFIIQNPGTLDTSTLGQGGNGVFGKIISKATDNYNKPINNNGTVPACLDRPSGTT